MARYNTDQSDASKKRVDRLTRGYPVYDRKTKEGRIIPSDKRPDTKQSKFRKLIGSDEPRVKDKEKWSDKPAYGTNQDRVRQTRKLEKEL